MVLAFWAFWKISRTASPVLENPQHFLRARAGAGAESQKSCGRGGQISKILRVRAGVIFPLNTQRRNTESLE